MGISSDGQLTFGIELGVEEEPPYFLGDAEEIEDLAIKEAGISQWSEDVDDDYWERVREARKAYPVCLELHCSYDYSMYILRPNVTGAHFRAPRGYPVEFDALPEIPEEAITAMREWCLAHGVEWKQPRWILSSLYG